MALDFSKSISSYKDFPKKGIIFRDFLPSIKDGKVFHDMIDTLADFAKQQKADVIVGPESRGFLLGTPMAYKLGLGFVPAQKPGKLPGQTISATYGLEYGKDTLYMEKGAIKPGQRVVLVDDLIATGGTADATIKLVQKLGGKVVGAAFVIELDALHGRDKLKQNIKDLQIKTLVHY